MKTFVCSQIYSTTYTWSILTKLNIHQIVNLFQQLKNEQNSRILTNRQKYEYLFGIGLGQCLCQQSNGIPCTMSVYTGIYSVKCLVSTFTNLLDGPEKLALIILLSYHMELVQLVVYSSCIIASVRQYSYVFAQLMIIQN